MNMKKKLPTIILFLTIISTFAILEWGHFKKNESEIKSRFYYQRVYDDFNKKTSIQLAKSDLVLMIRETFPQLPNYAEVDLALASLTEKTLEGEIDLSNIAKGIPKIEESRENWSRFLYLAGIDLIERNKGLGAEFFLVSAVRIAPYWSYFWISFCRDFD